MYQLESFAFTSVSVPSSFIIIGVNFPVLFVSSVPNCGAFAVPAVSSPGFCDPSFPPVVDTYVTSPLLFIVYMFPVFINFIVNTVSSPVPSYVTFTFFVSSVVDAVILFFSNPTANSSAVTADKSAFSNFSDFAFIYANLICSFSSPCISCVFA